MKQSTRLFAKWLDYWDFEKEYKALQDGCLSHEEFVHYVINTLTRFNEDLVNWGKIPDAKTLKIIVKEGVFASEQKRRENRKNGN